MLERSERPVALVTGAGQGIGRAIAERLSQDGFLVAVNDLVRDQRMDDVVAQTAGVAAPGDVADGHERALLIDNIYRTCGHIDTLVVNHAHMTMGPLLDGDMNDWWRVVDVNLSAAFHLVQAVVPSMREAGQGRIVFMSSEAGIAGWKDATAYAASKAGLIALTKALGRELAPEGIIVNAVAPGAILTEQLEVDAEHAGLTTDEMTKSYASQIPLGKVGRPEDVAAAVSMLADHRMAAFVGQVLQVNGGSTRARP